MRITTSSSFDDEGIFPLRTVRVGNKAVPTPTSVIQIQKKRNYEELNPESRGVVELYKKVDGTDVDEAMRKSSGGKLQEAFQDVESEIGDEELRVAFVRYDESFTLPDAHAKYLVEPISEHSDFVTVPVFTSLARGVDEDIGLEDSTYQTLKRSIVRYLDQVEEKAIEKPIMGVIPRLDWVFVEDLLAIYEDFNVRAFAVDFDRRKVTTGAQVDIIQPLMENIANRDLEERVLFYALNPSPGVSTSVIDARPAADIASLGVGFDIVGGRHIPFRGGSEAYEKMDDEDGEVTFRLFHKDEWVYRDHPLEELPDHFPADSGYEVEHVVSRVRKSPKNAKYRLQALVNGEQRALASKALRDKVEDENGFEYSSEKIGVTEQVSSIFEDVGASFDGARAQTGLDDF